MNNTEKIRKLKALYQELFQCVEKIDQRDTYINVGNIYYAIKDIVTYLNTTTDNEEKILLKIFKMHIRTLGSFKGDNDISSNEILRNQYDDIVQEIWNLLYAV